MRVRGFQETLRADESVLFQGFLTLRPGVYTASVMVRDRNSPASARRERTDTVPRLVGPALAAPVPFYEGTGRASTSVRPQLLVNPRATLPYGADTLRFYVEGYGLSSGTRLAAQAVDQNDKRPVAGYAAGPRLCGVVRARSSGSRGSQLPVGEQELRLGIVGGRPRRAGRPSS